MTTLIARPAIASHRYPNTHLAISPVAVITADRGQYSVLEVAQAYFSLGERPIPLCDATHIGVTAQHRDGYQGKAGNGAAPCKSPGKAPLERNYPRFATTAPSTMDIVRMFGSHRGNIGGVVPSGRIVIDIDPRSGGMESTIALTERCGPFPETPTVKSGGNGLHNYFLLPVGVTVPSGSLAASGYPGVEWKGAGAQVVLPPSVHTSGKVYRWEPGYALGEAPIALIPDWLLQLILKQSAISEHRPSHNSVSGDVRYAVQSLRVQEHFAALWLQVGIEVQPGFLLEEPEDNHPMAWQRIIGQEAGSEAETALTMKLWQLTRKHLAGFPGRTSVIDERQYLSFADYAKWKGRRNKGDLMSGVSPGLGVAQWNQWVEEHSRAGVASLGGVEVATLSCYLDGYRYRECRDAGDLAEEVSRRGSLLESLQVGKPGSSDDEQFRQRVEHWKESALGFLPEIYTLRRAIN